MLNNGWGIVYNICYNFTNILSTKQESIKLL